MPISTLPPEILTKIFLEAIALADFEPKNHEAPLNVSHTCKAWRQLLLTNCFFWARLNLVSAWPAYRERDIDIRLATMWLARTGKATISFHVVPGDKPDSEEDNMAVWHHEIVKRQSQWGDMNMKLYYPDHERSVMQTLPLEDLQNLTIWRIDDNDPFAIESDEPRVDKASFLIPDLSLTGQPIAPRLTTLRITGIFVDNRQQRGLLAMLRHCPNLETFAICYEDEDDFDLSEDTPICVLSKLKQLSLAGEFGRLHLFRKLRVPALDYLDVGDPFHVNGIREVSMLILLISESELSHSLRKLVLGNRDPVYVCHNEAALRLILGAVPELELLYIDLDSDSSTFACILLSLAPGGSGLCPRLDELHMCFYEDPDIEVLERMLSPRFESNDKFIASFCIDTLERLGKELLDTNSNFRQWKESGRLEIGSDEDIMNREHDVLMRLF